MRDMIEYTILKVVQVLALVTLPIFAYGEFRDGIWFWCGFDMWVWYTFYQKAKTNYLENRLHKDTL